MSPALRTLLLTAAALTGFAANSLLCRLALGSHLIDPASFTLVRIASGAVTLALLAPRALRSGSWGSALALFGYAVAFSFAYVRLTTGTGALILFACVQATMLGWSLLHEERRRAGEWIGLGIAMAGLVALTFPGLSAPEPWAALLMAAAGVAWGVYTLRGRGSAEPLGETAGNFARATLPALLVAVMAGGRLQESPKGVALAVASGTLASGLGYTLWYAVLPALGANRAAIVQFAVPVLAALGGVAFLRESVSWRLCLAGGAILAGIVVALRARATSPS